jgi:hypothetical protein
VDWDWGLVEERGGFCKRLANSILLTASTREFLTSSSSSSSFLVFTARSARSGKSVSMPCWRRAKKNVGCLWRVFSVSLCSLTACAGDPQNNPKATSDAFRTLFVGRLVSSSVCVCACWCACVCVCLCVCVCVCVCVTFSPDAWAELRGHRGEAAARV